MKLVECVPNFSEGRDKVKVAAIVDAAKSAGVTILDVIPFIPVAGVTIEDCAKLAEKLAERIGRELQIPAYLYDHAARKPERKDLANVRKGQFEGLKDLIGKDESRRPDF